MTGPNPLDPRDPGGVNLLQALGTPLLQRVDMFNAEWLMRQHFAPLRYVVPGAIPEGFTIVAGSPKVGKSWLTLDLALQLADGGLVFGAIPLEAARPVLLLALEDGPRRLQDRIRSLGRRDAPRLLDLVPRTNGVPILDVVAAWLDCHAGDAPVVAIDTIARGLPSAAAGESDYARDYRFGASVKELTDAVPGAAIIGVAHTRKADADDFLDTVSGTQGLAGSADSVVVLRRPRFGDSGTLACTSRDAAEGEYALSWKSGTWTLDGDNLTEAAARASKRRLTDGLSERSTALVQFVAEHPDGVTPAQVAEKHGIDSKTAGTYLGRAAKAGRIRRDGRGVYTPVERVESDETAPDRFTISTLSTPPEEDRSCRVCRTRLHPALTGDVHPTCEPEEPR